MLGDTMSEQTNKERVLEALRSNGQRAIPELAGMLGIAESTVKYNLLVLATEGKIRRIQKSARIILWEAVRDE